MDTPKNIEESLNKGNFIYMLIGLLTLSLIGPLITQWYPDGSRIITQFAFMSVMVIGVWSLNKQRVWFMAGLTLIILSLFFTFINYFINSKSLLLIGLFNTLLFCILSMIVAIRQILFRGSITTNKIVGSICIYLLLGYIWAIIYIFIDVVFPNSFNGIASSSNYNDYWDLIYYSFVTLTTLGYGDVSPAIPIARSFSYLEAICGQFYLAILVASLVGAYLADHSKPDV
ncbi:MAG TPA: two pore domain potassium channel family protein [Thiotrichaceae bacterium]|jgi:hypothetical protein|nr:two pore domain potassium channel family protein [Thiotrichaceae bacterium]HIM08208.1 two pore domain potassium channel family protein [Gammaproteobacteria bacterium]